MKDKLVIDLGKIMDDIFQAAEKVGSAVHETLDFEKIGGRLKARWNEDVDYYPTYSYPPLNVYIRADKSLVFEFALAGFNENRIDLEFRGDYLVFSAKVDEEILHQENVKYFKRRLKFKDVSDQRYFVPEDKFDREKVKATFRNGVLTVLIPPLEDAQKTSGIKIEIVKEEE